VSTRRIGFAASLAIAAALILGFAGLYANVQTGMASAGYNRARFFFQSNAAMGLNQYNAALSHFSPYRPREGLNCAYMIVNAIVTNRLDRMGGDNLARALRLAREAESALPQDPLVYMVLNEIYNGLGIYVDEMYLVRAEEAGNRALQLSPRRQEVMFNLGRTYVLAGKPQMAVDLNRAMIAQYPELPRAHWLLGLALMASEEPEAAKESIEKALKMGYWFKNPEEEKTVTDLFGKAEFNELMRRIGKR
jgi:tetratricopeptide (TPR) repeat protein